MSILTRDEILELGARRSVQRLTVPEWGGEVYVREITAGEYDRLQMMHYEATKGANQTLLRANWVVSFMSDSDGNRILTDRDVADVAKMGAKAIDRIYEAGQRFNALDEADELEKNSEAVQDGDSCSS